MRNSRSGYKDKQVERRILVDLTCIPRHHVLEAMSLTATSALLLSRSIRRDTCLYMLIDYGGDYVVEMCGNSLRGYRPDLGSSTGFLKRVISRGCFGGACIRPASSLQGFSCTSVEDFLAEPCKYRAPLCLKTPCTPLLGEPWWLVVVANIVADNCERRAH